MIKISNFKILDDYKLLLTFEDGERKVFSLAPYLEKGVFQELKNKDYFKQVKNEGYFISWPNEQDISSDTLFIEGNKES